MCAKSKDRIAEGDFMAENGRAKANPKDKYKYELFQITCAERVPKSWNDASKM